MEVTLTKITHLTKDRDGNPLMTKAGKPYVRCLINTVEHGEKALSGFGGPATNSWKEGDKVNLEVEESGQYLNFKVPRQSGVSNEKLDQILNKLTGISINQQIIMEHMGVKRGEEKPVEEKSDYPELDPDNIPF